MMRRFIVPFAILSLLFLSACTSDRKQARKEGGGDAFVVDLTKAVGGAER